MHRARLSHAHGIVAASRLEELERIDERLGPSLGVAKRPLSVQPKRLWRLVQKHRPLSGWRLSVGPSVYQNRKASQPTRATAEMASLAYLLPVPLELLQPLERRGERLVQLLL